MPSSRALRSAANAGPAPVPGVPLQQREISAASLSLLHQTAGADRPHPGAAAAHVSTRQQTAGRTPRRDGSAHSCWRASVQAAHLLPEEVLLLRPGGGDPPVPEGARGGAKQPAGAPASDVAAEPERSPVRGHPPFQS